MLSNAALDLGAGLTRSGTLTSASATSGSCSRSRSIAPLLASTLPAAGDRATAAARPRSMLDAPVGLTKKVPVALDLRDGLPPDAGRPASPTYAAPFDAHGAATDPKLAAARDDVVAAIEGTITRAFRPAFLLSAAFAAAALALALLLRPEAARVSRPLATLLALLAAAVVLVAVELGRGALGYGSGKLANPCVERTFPGGGFDAAVQRIVLDGLDGAACRLGTSREELVLSLGTGAATRRAAGAGSRSTPPCAPACSRPSTAAEARGDLPPLVAPLLRRAVETRADRQARPRRDRPARPDRLGAYAAGMTDPEQRLEELWARLDELDEDDFLARMDALAAELPPAVAAFERASAFDSTGHSDRAVPLYREALELGLDGIRRRRATIQLASSLRNLGRARRASSSCGRSASAARTSSTTPSPPSSRSPSPTPAASARPCRSRSRPWRRTCRATRGR